MKRLFYKAILIATGLLLMWWSLRGIDLHKVWVNIKQANVWYLFLVAFLGILSHILRALRWQQLLQAVEQPITFKNSFGGVMIGYLVNLAVPPVGNFSRVANLRRTERVPFAIGLGTVVSERVVDFVSLGVAIVISISLQYHILHDMLIDILNYNFFVTIAIAISFLGILYFLRDKIGLRLQKMLQGFILGVKSLFLIRNTGRFIIYTLVIWVCYWLLAYLTFFALDATSKLDAITGLTVTILGVVSAAAPSPGGIGVFHVLIASALALVGVPFDDAMSYAILAHGVQMLTVLSVGSICLMIAKSASEADEYGQYLFV